MIHELFELSLTTGSIVILFDNESYGLHDAFGVSTLRSQPCNRKALLRLRDATEPFTFIEYRSNFFGFLLLVIITLPINVYKDTSVLDIYILFRYGIIPTSADKDF